MALKYVYIVFSTRSGDMDPTYPLVPILSIVVCFLCILPIVAGLFALRNIGVYSYAIWVSVMNLSFAINTVVWSDNTDNSAPVWCDIC